MSLMPRTVSISLYRLTVQRLPQIRLDYQKPSKDLGGGQAVGIDLKNLPESGPLQRGKPQPRRL